jgi:hypothetical protein
LYFPLLRGKRFEGLAIKAISTDLAAAGNVVPIIEPVAGETWIRLKVTLDDLPMAVITNPKVGPYSEPKKLEKRIQQPMPLKAAGVYGHPNAIWALVINEDTLSSEVALFNALCPGRRMFVVMALPKAHGVDDPIPAAVRSNPEYFVINHHALVPTTARSVTVDLQDAFLAQDENVSYPPDEFYSNRHATIRTDATFEHFGDYSIVGKKFRKGGGKANNVALHHVYTIGPNPSDLRIKHYVSANDPSEATMWHDALTQLVNDLPSLRALSPLNDTAVIPTYIAMQKSGDYPGLGKMKEWGIRHQLLLMTVVQ